MSYENQDDSNRSVNVLVENDAHWHSLRSPHLTPLRPVMNCNEEKGINSLELPTNNSVVVRCAHLIVRGDGWFLWQRYAL